MDEQIRAYLNGGHFAMGVAILRQLPGVPFSRLKHFEGYLNRSFVPTDVEERLRGLVRQSLVSPLTPRGGNSPLTPRGGNSPLALPPNPQRGEWLPAPDSPFTIHHSPLKNSLSFWADLFQKHPDPPDAILEMRDRAIELHKRQSAVHALMGDAARRGDKKNAYQYAREIMEEIIPTLDGIYDAAREWMKSGALPALVQRDDTAATVMEKMKQVKYLNERCCRLRRWITSGQQQRTVEGKKVKVLLTLREMQDMEKELVDRELKMKELKDELGI